MLMPCVDGHCAKSRKEPNRCVNQVQSDKTPCKKGYETATSRWIFPMETPSMKEAGELCFVCWPNDLGRHAVFNMWSQRSRSCRIVRGVVTFICPPLCSSAHLFTYTFDVQEAAIAPNTKKAKLRPMLTNKVLPCRIHDEYPANGIGAHECSRLRGGTPIDHASLLVAMQYCPCCSATF